MSDCAIKIGPTSKRRVIFKFAHVWEKRKNKKALNVKASFIRFICKVKTMGQFMFLFGLSLLNTNCEIYLKIILLTAYIKLYKSLTIEPTLRALLKKITDIFYIFLSLSL